MNKTRSHKKILIIDANPSSESLCKELADSYQTGAKNSSFLVERLNLRDLSFNLNFSGYSDNAILEDDLVMSQNFLKWCDHLVVVYPIWWGSMPALLKGFFDRVLLPGFAFKYHKTDSSWDKLLAGKTARMIVTSDSPVWYIKLFNLSSSYRVIKNSILNFCGFSPVKVSAIGQVRKLTHEKKKKLKSKIKNLGSIGR